MRAADVAEAAALLEFWAQAAQGATVSDDLDGVQRLLDHDAAAVLVAEVDGRTVGTVVAGFDGWRCHLYRLAVHPDARRQGVARALLSAAEERFRGLGGRRVDAMVLDDNDDAHALYRAAGYAPQPTWSRWVRFL